MTREIPTLHSEVPPGDIASDTGSSEAPATQEVQMANTSDRGSEIAESQIELEAGQVEETKQLRYSATYWNT